MTQFADLHIHTHYSDSTFSPKEVIREAVEAGLSAIAITDHDTVDGIAETEAVAKDFNLEIISGIELSSEIHEKDVHILGYFIDYTNRILRQELEKMQAVRLKRIEAMVEKLKDQGINGINPNEVFELSKSDAVGRMHLATILKQKGAVASIAEAFDKYIGEDCPAYVKKFKVTPYEAIALIRQAGGIAVLAHPMVTAKDELIPSLIEAGLRGIEVYYPNYSETTIRFYEGLAKKYKLIATGGSDAHGDVKANTFIGKVRIPYEIVTELKAGLNR